MTRNRTTVSKDGRSISSARKYRGRPDSKPAVNVGGHHVGDDLRECPACGLHARVDGAGRFQRHRVRQKGAGRRESWPCPCEHMTAERFIAERDMQRRASEHAGELPEKPGVAVERLRALRKARADEQSVKDDARAAQLTYVARRTQELARGDSIETRSTGFPRFSQPTTNGPMPKMCSIAGSLTCQIVNHASFAPDAPHAAREDDHMVTWSDVASTRRTRELKTDHAS